MADLIDGVAAKAPPPRAISDAPDEAGFFGAYGGRHVPDALQRPLAELESTYASVCRDAKFWADLKSLLNSYAGRPTPLYPAERLTKFIRASAGRGRGAMIYLKREDLAHTGSHAINNALAQALLARRAGKSRVIAETGSGQHGVAVAAAAAHFGLTCEIYMGTEDSRRQHLNVTRMELLGARIIHVADGSRTLRDAMSQALRDWSESSDSTHYIIGSAVGPHPYPMMVRDFHSIIGRETKGQALKLFQKLPDAIVACVGRGSSAAGIFYPFVDESAVRLVGVEAGGRSSAVGDHAASLAVGSPGVLHGMMTYLLQDETGQPLPTRTCAPGMDYPAVGPELAHWKDLGRAAYSLCTDREALDAFGLLARTEGILPGLEAAHAIHGALGVAAGLDADKNIVVCLSGRGDKDADEVARVIREGTQ